MDMDIFEKYIKENKRNEECRALTCKSYGEVYKKDKREELESKKTNFELATYGDALLKFVLCDLFLDKKPQLSEYKKKYEEDKFLIEVIAKHYNLLEYMNFDREDKKIPQEYVMHESGNKNKNATKYIATTVEAVLGAIYLENRTFESIRNLVESWTNLV